MVLGQGEQGSLCVGRAFGASGTPSAVLIDAEGRLSPRRWPWAPKRFSIWPEDYLGEARLEGLFLKDSNTRAAGATARLRGRRADMHAGSRPRDSATFVALRMTLKAWVGSVAICRVRASLDPARLARVQRYNPQIATRS